MRGLPVSALRHLGRCLWGARYSPEKEFALLACYLDEAGGNKEGFTVVGGFVSTAALWEQFEIDWRLMLASYKIPHFHMKEFSQSNGPFKKWNDLPKIRRRFLHDATDIIRQRAQWAVFCYVHHQVYEIVDRHFALTETLSSPYAVAGRTCVAQVGLWNRSTNSPLEDIKFVFEDGGPDKGGLLAAMNIAPTLPDPIFEPSREIKNKLGIPRPGLVQLQAADFLAYELRKHRREAADRTGRPVRRSFYEILKVPVMFMGALSDKNAALLCQVERIPKR